MSDEGGSDKQISGASDADEHAPGETAIPELPGALHAPEPVVVVGMLAFVVASIVVGATGWGGGSALAICLTGLVVGVLGTSIFLVQRAASRRGDKTAQRGLD